MNRCQTVSFIVPRLSNKTISSIQLAACCLKFSSLLLSARTSLWSGISLTHERINELTDSFPVSFHPFSRPSFCQGALPKWGAKMDKIYYLVQISQAFLTISWLITEKVKMILQ